VLRAQRLLQGAQHRQKQYADRDRRDDDFSVGESVLLSTKHVSLKGPIDAKKLRPRWIGPFTVKEKIGTVAYRLELPPHLRMHDVFHVSLLRRYLSDGRSQPPPPLFEIDGESFWEIAAIVDRRELSNGRRKRVQYLVSWQGYGHEHDTWEPAENVRHCKELLQEFEARSRSPASK
jgi:Chromo (CHRromatin Organisation MOdifier) domain